MGSFGEPRILDYFVGFLIERSMDMMHCLQSLFERLIGIYSCEEELRSKALQIFESDSLVWTDLEKPACWRREKIVFSSE